MKSLDTPLGNLTDVEREAIALVGKVDDPEDRGPNASDLRIAYMLRHLAHTEDFLIIVSGCRGYVAGVEAERARTRGEG